MQTHISKLTLHAAFILVLCALWAFALQIFMDRERAQAENSTAPAVTIIREPVYIEVEKEVLVITPVEVEKQVYIEKPVYVEKTVEVTRDVPVRLQDWESPEELAEFLGSDNTDEYLFLQADAKGGISFNGQCEDLALQLRDRAMAAGKYLSIEVLNPAEYRKWYGVTVAPNVYHAICMARIGNEFWYIEPSNDRHWLALNLD